MGLVNRHVLYSMRCDEHGRALLIDANERRAILRVCRSGSPVRPIRPASETRGLIYTVDGVHWLPGSPAGRIGWLK